MNTTCSNYNHAIVAGSLYEYDPEKQLATLQINLATGLIPPSKKYVLLLVEMGDELAKTAADLPLSTEYVFWLKIHPTPRVLFSLQWFIPIDGSPYSGLVTMPKIFNCFGPIRSIQDRFITLGTDKKAKTIPISMRMFKDVQIQPEPRLCVGQYCWISGHIAGGEFNLVADTIFRCSPQGCLQAIRNIYNEYYRHNN